MHFRLLFRFKCHAKTELETQQIRDSSRGEELIQARAELQLLRAGLEEREVRIRTLEASNHALKDSQVIMNLPLCSDNAWNLSLTPTRMVYGAFTGSAAAACVSSGQVH